MDACVRWPNDGLKARRGCAGREDRLQRVRGDDEERGPRGGQPQETARRHAIGDGGLVEEAGGRSATEQQAIERACEAARDDDDDDDELVYIFHTRGRVANVHIYTVGLGIENVRTLSGAHLLLLWFCWFP